MPLTLFSKYEHTCLEILANSIRECHSLGASKWGITVYHPQSYFLTMGCLAVMTLEFGTIWLALDFTTKLEKAKLDKMVNWRWSLHYKHHRVPSITGYYWPMMDPKEAEHAKNWPLIQSLHYRYLSKVADKFPHLRITSQASHSNQALADIETELGLTLPRPNYSRS